MADYVFLPFAHITSAFAAQARAMGTLVQWNAHHPGGLKDVNYKEGERLFVMGHCDRGSNVLGTSATNAVTAVDAATVANRLQRSGLTHRCDKIKLIACSAGAPDAGHSFASRLQEALSKLDPPYVLTVVGANLPVTTPDDFGRTYQATNPHSKRAVLAEYTRPGDGAGPSSGSGARSPRRK